MTSAPFIIETALLLLVTYVIGCVIGDFARRLSLGEAILPQLKRTPGADLPKPVTAKPVRTAQRIPAPVPEKKAAELPAGPALAASPVATAAPAATIAVAVEPAPVRPKRTTKPRNPAPAAVVASAPDGKPQALAAPLGGTKDNLRLIKGIGPKIESMLNDLGVFHFDQIAAWDEATSAWVDAHLGFKGRVGRENWIAQAKAKLEPEPRPEKPVK
jgi:NADH-quinone oxidoreductase subunit E